MPFPPRPLPDDLPAAFSVRAAAAAGVSPKRLRASDLETPYRGARTRRPQGVPEDPDGDAAGENQIAAEATRLRADLLLRARAYMSVAPEHAYLFSATAAVVWNLPLPIGILRAATLDVAVPPPHRAPRRAGIRSRQLASDLHSVRRHDGLRVASPASVWVQLAPVLTVEHLIELGDAIVHVPRVRGMLRGDPGSGLATIESLAAAISAGRRPGASKLRSALPEIRVGSASPSETKLRRSLIRAGMPHPELDFDVFDEFGIPIGFTELAYPDYKLLIEYEGDHHRVSREQWNRDIEKHARCVAAGWTVLRITSAHMRDDARIAVQKVRDALLRAGWEG